MKRNVLLAAFTIITCLALLFLPSAFAADCKGLSKSKCQSNSKCSWVDSYKTKAGKTVKGYCRAKPGEKKSTTSTSKKSTSSKDSSKSKKSTTTDTGSKKSTTKK